MIAENTAAAVRGRYLLIRYADILDPPKEDTRTCEEITNEVIARCGLTVRKGGEVR